LQLEKLKKKSLLENLGDGFRKIGMHDLWHEFARLETKIAKYNVLEEVNRTNDGQLLNLRQMFFFEKGYMKAKDVKFACFPNVTVLKLNGDLARISEMDLRGLKHLKSLEVDLSEYFSWRSHLLVSFIELGSLSNLCFLQWLNIPQDSPCIDKIARLTNL